MLLTPLCRVSGEEVADYLDESRYRVLIGLGVHPEAAFAGCVCRDRSYARHPCPCEEPHRLLSPESPDEILHRRAGGERNAVYLASLQPQGQLLFTLRSRNRLVGGWDDDLGSGPPEHLREDLTCHPRPRDENAFSGKPTRVQNPDKGLGPKLVGDHVDTQSRLLEPPGRRRADGGQPRPT